MRCKPTCLAWTAIAYLCILECGLLHAFNVDTEHCVRHFGPPGSMFGFTVAEHREAGNSWVLIGAPEAQTTQPGVIRGGAVFKCNIVNDQACQEIPFDITGNNNSSRGSQIDNKSNQWFGASLSSSGENGVVVACAPRYVWHSIDYKKREPVGTCFVSKNSFSDFSEYSPCRTPQNWGYHRQGTCQAGLGAAVSKDGEWLFVGAPGSYYWQGQVFSQNLYDRPELKATKEGPKFDDDSYLGYSVAAGTFSGESGVAVGMPRGAKLLGKVALYTTNMTNLQNITGEQLGAYFGYAVTTSDVDGDGADDLIIGAPMYTNANTNYETGCVYIVYQGRETFKFNRVHSRHGKNSKARFGLSLCNLGDINKDGFGDFAVGAPYDGPNERGVVYIFHGSREGARENPSQVITAEDVSKFGIISPPTTFGFSLAGGSDLDENQYPDLIIGAYESNTAFFLRSRPVVKVKSSLNFASESKQIILEEKNCTLKDSSKVTCLNLTACLEYNGVGVDQQTQLNVQILLDSKKVKSPRMFFLSTEGKNVMNQTLKLIAGTQFCKSMFVYVKPLVRDKLTSLEAEMRYSLVEPVLSTSYRLNRQLFPILDMDDETGLVSRDSVSIQKNCGKDNVCIPDLKLAAVSNVERYILGSGSRIEVDVLVKNEGEDSFETSYEMGVPVGLNFVNVQRYEEGDRDVPLTCTPPSYLNNNTLHCDIGNPLPSNKMIHFKVLLQPAFKESLKPRYEFWMAVNSSNPEITTSVSDNRKDMSIPIMVETDLVVEGSSHPSDLHYNASLYESTTITEENQAGPQLIHIYNIRNKGPSDILGAEAYFLWPSYTVEGDNLLYLLEQPETSGPIKCEFIDNINEKKLKLENKASYLETAGVVGNYAGLSSVHSTHNNVEAKTGVSYAEEKSSHASTSFTSQKVAGGKQMEPGKSFAASGVAHQSGSQGKHHYVSETDYSESGFGGAANVKQNAVGKIAYETSVADLTPASGRRQEENIQNVIDDKIIQYGTIGQGASYGTLGLGTLGEESNYRTVGQSNYQGGSSNVYGGSSSTHNSGHSASESAVSGGSTSYSAAGAGRRYGGGSVSSGTNAVWTQGAGRDWNNGGRNSSSFHSAEKSHSSNTTWDSLHNTPITSSQDSWRTNDNGSVRNGSSSTVYSEPSGNVYMGRAMGGVSQYSGGESRRTSESETEYRTRTENVQRVGSSSRDSPSEYSEEDYYNRDRDTSVRDRELAQAEQDRKYQEELRKYYANIERLKKEDDEKRKLEDEIRRRKHERYLEEQKKVRQYGDDGNLVDDSYGRYKRQEPSPDEALESALKCGPTKCIQVKCYVGELRKDQEAWVAFRSRVWMPTIRKIAPNKEVSLSSLLVARVTKIPHIGTPEQSTIKTHEIFTKVIPRETGVPAGMVPLWVVVLAAVAGAIILMLLVYLLYKWGFFVRRRPTDAPEKEPLNRNGYQHSDD